MIRKSLLFITIIGFFTYLVFATIATAQSSIYKLSGVDLEHKLMTRFTFIFYSEIERAGAYITDESWEIIGNHLRRGAAQVASEGPLTPEKLEMAELNVRRFASAAITFGRIGPTGEIRIGESTWARMKSTICPLSAIAKALPQACTTNGAKRFYKQESAG